jgi:rhamnose utilization protein RhaD (predicted bifunctional aldolase and dehydrogenase)
VILLQNHGLIALGETAEHVQAATFMTVKSAHIFAGAAALGGPTFLTPAQVEALAPPREEEGEPSPELSAPLASGRAFWD